MRSLARMTTQHLVWLGVTWLAAQSAAAQEPPVLSCTMYFDCPRNMDCDSYTYTVCPQDFTGCPGAADCSAMLIEDGVCHREALDRCFPTFIRPCDTDADCGPHFFCGSQERLECRGNDGTGGGGAPIDIGGAGGSSGECAAKRVTERICMPSHTLCTTNADCSPGFECAFDPYCPPFWPEQPPSGTGGIGEVGGTGGTGAATGSGGAYVPELDPSWVEAHSACDKVCVAPFDPFVPPTFGTGGSGGSDEDGGTADGQGIPNSGGTGGAASSAGSGGAGSVMSSAGSGGTAASSGGAAGMGASQHGGQHHHFHLPLFGCSAGGELGATGWNWLWLGVASLVLRRRARRP
jgi:hypothetical protein